MWRRSSRSRSRRDGPEGGASRLRRRHGRASQRAPAAADLERRREGAPLDLTRRLRPSQSPPRASLCASDAGHLAPASDAFMSSSVGIARAISACLQPLQGDAASGQLLVRSTAPTGTLFAGAVGVPIVAGSFDEAGMVFVTKNPATTTGRWGVTDAGALVDVESINGGLVANQPAGTEYRWFPPQPGIEAT